MSHTTWLTACVWVRVCRSRWAKHALKQQKHNPALAQAVQEQVAKGEELRRKQMDAEAAGSDDDSDDDSDDESEGGEPLEPAERDAKLLWKLQNEAEPERPSKGVFGMAFMRRAHERQRSEAQQMLDELSADLRHGSVAVPASGGRGDEGSDASDEEGTAGRDEAAAAVAPPAAPPAVAPAPLPALSTAGQLRKTRGAAAVTVGARLPMGSEGQEAAGSPALARPRADRRGAGGKSVARVAAAPAPSSSAPARPPASKAEPGSGWAVPDIVSPAGHTLLPRAQSDHFAGGVAAAALAPPAAVRVAGPDEQGEARAEGAPASKGKRGRASKRRRGAVAGEADGAAEEAADAEADFGHGGDELVDGDARFSPSSPLSFPLPALAVAAAETSLLPSHSRAPCPAR